MMSSEIPTGLILDYILVPWAFQGSVIPDFQCKLLRKLNIVWKIPLLCGNPLQVSNLEEILLKGSGDFPEQL